MSEAFRDQPEERLDRPEQPEHKTLMRSLGEFFGEIFKGISTDPSKPEPTRTVTKQTVEEETRQTPEGPVVLRRTIIEEVELPAGSKAPKETRGEQ